MRRRHRLIAAFALGAGAAALPSAAHAAPVVMAKLGPSASAADADALGRRTGLALRTFIPQIGWAVYDADGDLDGARRALRDDPAVFRLDWGRPGDAVETHFTPRDNIFTGPGSVAVNGLPPAPWNWHFVVTNFPAAWDISRGSANVRVAVIDSEFDTEHLELKTKLATGRNFESGTPDYRTSNVRAINPNEIHGSHTSGLVAAATDNGNGVAGACFDCTVIPFKVGTSGVVGGVPNVDAKFVADLTEALTAAADSDAVVISMSLGTRRDHAPLRDAVAYAKSKGKVVVASAGNNQLNFPGVANYPAAYQGVFAVAATRPDDSIAPFSSNGDYVDIAAPGDSVLSTWDTRIAPGAPNGPTHGVGFRTESGTSMSAPIVAGLAALVRTRRPDLTPDEVEAIISQSAVDLGATGRDPVFGAGRIDAAATLRNAVAYVRPAPPAPGPPAAGRTRSRFFYSCTIGRATLRAGNPRAFRTRLLAARLVCTGRTAPALRGVRLEVQRFSARGGWRRIGFVRTNNRGRFGFVRRLGTRGNWTVRVAFPGNAAVAPARSLATRVLVR